jgi:tetratricopeptide (TPR) repeat protein
MPPTKPTGKDDDDGAGRASSLVKRVREARRSEFSSGALHREFEAHVTGAQDFFLKGNTSAAEKEATLALRIRPTAHLFALLAVIAESKGKFDRASDFRLLQAFLARDITLWEELLHEFMSQQFYFKSVVCLQRMSALEKDKTRYRALQLQLADLLIGLGEIRRATNVLVPLWNSSRCRDFEVFALLSSLYFQLGKWASLQRLIESSVKYAFHASSSHSTTAADATSSAPESAESPSVANAKPDEEVAGADYLRSGPPVAAPSLRVSKRVRFFGVEEVGEASAGGDGSAPGQPTPSPPPFLSPSASSLDEFSFDDALSPSAHTPSPTLSSLPFGYGASDNGGGRVTSQTAPNPGGVVHHLYGERIELTTEQSKKNFLTLVNVHSELLNEQGSFTDTVHLLHMAAACLEVDVMELPPDLLVRLGVAYAFLGGVWEQPCRDVFQHLVEHCSMEDYGDVLMDAAVSLQKVGMHTEAAQLYTSLLRYHQFAYDQLHKQVGVREVELALMQDSASPAQVQAATEARDAVRAEENDVKTVLAAANLGEAQCAYAREMFEEARQYAERVLELDPTHLQARLLLGRYFFYQRNDTAAAVEVLTPRENEPALQRIQLGAFLVQVFQSAKRYVEAIALGVSIFEVLLSSEEDGDTQSVAPGTSSRRATASLYLPTMTRASSAIIPAASLAGMARGAAGSSVAARTSFSLAASIRASSSVARMQLSRRGLESLTTTVYGASAAASVATGWDKKEAEERMKDTSTIFQFNRRRRKSGNATAGKQPTMGDGGAPATAEASKSEGPGPVSQTAEERREAVLRMAPSDFWKAEVTDGAEDDAEESTPVLKKAKTEGDNAVAENGEVTVQPVKQEPAAEDEVDKELVAVSPSGGKRDREGGADDATGGAKSAASSRAAAGGTRKRTKKEGGEKTADRPVQSNYTTVNEREHDLEELEDFLTQAEQLAAESEADTRVDRAGEVVDSAKGSVAANEAGESADTQADTFELPSLEEVSRQFDDPVMAQLFLDASSFTPGGGVRGGGGKGDAGDTSDPWAALAEANNDTTVAPPLPSGTGLADKVTLSEAMEALGKAGFIALAVAVVDCYSAVGKFIEAREFAFVSLTHFQQKRRLRQLGHRLGRPLRLAVLRAALAAGEGEDAYRVGLRLLQEDTAEDKRHEVVELMHSVLNRCEDRSSILYRAVVDGYGDPALLVLLANRYHQTRSYTRALNLYLVALQERPTDIFLNFMVGLSYLLCSHQKRIRLREACVSAAIYYLTQYQQLRLSLEPSAAAGEVLYNVARALQFLKLSYLCIPLYERVAYDLRAPSECTVALQRAARLNLYFLYRWGAGNRTLALTALQPHETVANNHACVKRVSSPFAS